MMLTYVYTKATHVATGQKYWLATYIHSYILYLTMTIASIGATNPHMAPFLFPIQQLRILQ